jgi:hypothetical protein
MVRCYNCWTYFYDILPDDVHVTIRKKREIEYEVINSGAEWEIYDVGIKDDFYFAVQPNIHQHNISAGGSVHGTFSLFPYKLENL